MGGAWLFLNLGKTEDVVYTTTQSCIVYFFLIIIQTETEKIFYFILRGNYSILIDIQYAKILCFNELIKFHVKEFFIRIFEPECY